MNWVENGTVMMWWDRTVSGDLVWRGSVFGLSRNKWHPAQVLGINFYFLGKFLLNNTDIVRPHAGAVMKCDEMMNLVMTHTFPSSNEILAEDDDSAPFVGNLELSKWVETFYNKPHNSQNSGQLLACRVRWILAIKRGSQRSFSPDMTENV